MSVTVGTELPELTIPITATLIAGGAFATRDWSLVHHDKQAANDAGTPDIFMNILTTNGLVGRYVTDWAGPGAVLHDINIRLGAPNYPGDAMTFTGTITEHDPASGRVEVQVVGTNSLGSHVTATVSLTISQE